GKREREEGDFQRGGGRAVWGAGWGGEGGPPRRWRGIDRHVVAAGIRNIQVILAELRPAARAEGEAPRVGRRERHAVDLGGVVVVDRDVTAVIDVQVPGLLVEPKRHTGAGVDHRLAPAGGKILPVNVTSH